MDFEIRSKAATERYQADVETASSNAEAALMEVLELKAEVKNLKNDVRHLVNEIVRLQGMAHHRDVTTSPPYTTTAPVTPTTWRDAWIKKWKP